MNKEVICFFEMPFEWQREKYLNKLKNKLKEINKEVEIYFVDYPLDETTVRMHPEISIAVIYINSYITSKVLEKLSNLKFLITRTTGIDHIDLLASKRQGVTVANIPYYASITVTEHTIALMFALARKMREVLQKTQKFRFSRDGLLGLDLCGKTIGVIGTGNIGKEIVRIAYGIGMKILAYDINPSQELIEKYQVKYVSLEELLENSDVIIVMVPYYSKTHHLINKNNIKLIKETAMLINTARGPIVDTEALIWALENGKLKGGVAIDVFEGEKVLLQNLYLKEGYHCPEEEKKALKTLHLLKYPNVMLTPHVAHYSIEAIDRVIDCVVEEIAYFLLYGTSKVSFKVYF